MVIRAAALGPGPQVRWAARANSTRQVGPPSTNRQDYFGGLHGAPSRRCKQQAATLLPSPPRSSASGTTSHAAIRLLKLHAVSSNFAHYKALRSRPQATGVDYRCPSSPAPEEPGLGGTEPLRCQWPPQAQLILRGAQPSSRTPPAFTQSPAVLLSGWRSAASPSPPVTASLCSPLLDWSACGPSRMENMVHWPSGAEPQRRAVRRRDRRRPNRWGVRGRPHLVCAPHLLAPPPFQVRQQPPT